MGKRTLRWTLIILVVAAVAAALWWISRPEPVPVTVRSVERGTVETTVANTRAGTITACRRARLSPSAGGQIAVLPVKEGDKVKQGDLLLELWNQDLVAEAELANREAESAKASARATCLTADEALRNARRQKSLLSRKLVSEETVDAAETLAKSRAAECEAAQMSARVREAQVGVVQANLAKTRLLAPFNGVVAEINGELNEYVTPSPPGIPTVPAIDLIDNSCFYVAAPIDEVDVSGVTRALPARITLDAFGTRQFAGQVRRIGDYVVDVEKQARTVEVEVAFDNPAEYQRLLAGYSADVEIILDVRKDVLRIPSEAILENNQVFVFLPDAKTVEKRTVRIGAHNWNFSEVLDGLNAGEMLVTNPDTEGLADGVSVQPAEAAATP